MRPDIIANYARDISFVTFTMVEVLDAFDDTDMAGSTRYHVFNGFMGFCDYAGDAGLALARACDGLFTDGWIEIVEDYARAVVMHAITSGKPASAEVLRQLARKARDALPTEGGAP